MTVHIPSVPIIVPPFTLCSLCHHCHDPSPYRQSSPQLPPWLSLPPPVLPPQTNNHHHVPLYPCSHPVLDHYFPHHPCHHSTLVFTTTKVRAQFLSQQRVDCCRVRGSQSR